MNAKQIAWAAKHDWFVGQDSPTTIIVTERWTVNGEHYERDMVWRNSFAELRRWAGY